MGQMYEIIGGPDDGRLLDVRRIEGDKAVVNVRSRPNPGSPRGYVVRFARIPVEDLESDHYVKIDK